MADFRVLRLYRENKKVVGRLESSAIDDLSAGEVVIKIAYSSINYKDALAVTGAGNILRRFPLIAGIDAAGYVVSSVSKAFKEGDAVVVTGYEFGTDHDGGYAEYARVPAAWVVPLPDKISPRLAMAIGTAGFTVALCVHRLEQNMQTPEHGPFVITGASGGVGNFAIDVLSRLGYQIVAISRKQQDRDRLLALGASTVLDLGTLQMGEAPLEKGQWGGAIDNVGGDVLSWLTRTTSPWGNIVAVGMAAGGHFNTSVMPFILRGISVLGVSSATCPRALRHELWQRLATDLSPVYIDQIVTQVVCLEDINTVCDTLLDGSSSGRAIVKISE